MRYGLNNRKLRKRRANQWMRFNRRIRRRWVTPLLWQSVHLDYEANWKKLKKALDNLPPIDSKSTGIIWGNLKEPPTRSTHEETIRANKSG